MQFRVTFLIIWCQLFLTSTLCLTSPGQLLDIFSDIYQSTGTFPDDKDEYTQLSIVNRPTNLCLTVLERKVGNGGRVGADKCYLTNVETPEMFWLRHAGEGYVTLSTPWNKCVGAGERQGALLWTGDWCSEHIFQFLLTDVSFSGVRIRNRATGRFVTAPEAAKQQAVMLDDLVDDPRQLWFLCDPSGTQCWPPVPVLTTTTAAPTTTETPKVEKQFPTTEKFENKSSDYEDYYT